MNEASRIPGLVCAFAIGTRCYAVDVALVSEVVTIEGLTPVPQVPRAVLGVFSLRGTPVALLDPAALLELPAEDVAEESTRLGLLVMPGKTPLGALQVSRVEGIVEVQPEHYRMREKSEEEHPAVQGFLRLTHRHGLMATVLNMDVVMQRITWLKPRER